MSGRLYDMSLFAPVSSLQFFMAKASVEMLMISMYSSPTLTVPSLFQSLRACGRNSFNTSGCGMAVGPRVGVPVIVRVGVRVGLANLTPAHLTAGLSWFNGVAGDISAKSVALSLVS